MGAIADPGRIVVGVDGSASSIEALRYAADLARVLGHRLDVVTTWVPPVADSYIYHGDWRPEDDAKSLQSAAITDVFGDEPPVGLTTQVIAGPAPPTLIQQSETARMLVVGSRGRGGFIGLLLGSVSANCAEHAHCPVLIVHPSSRKASAMDRSAEVV